MTKKNKIVIIVLAVILTVSATFAGLTMNKSFVRKLTGSIDADSGGESITSVLTAEFKSDYPLIQTQQNNIFYEAHPDGTIKYYKYADGTFAEITSGIKTTDVKLTCSYQTVTVKLYYMSADVGTVGYGLFNSQQDSDIKMFSYIFVRMMDCPPSYSSTAKTDYVLLTDMDANDSYKIDKTYSDIYSFDMNSGKTTLIVSQRDRTVQSDGAFSENWTIFTDSSLDTMNKLDLFASARNYDVKTDSQQYDFMSVVNSRSMKKSSVATVVDSPSFHIREKDGDYFCFVNTDDGFDLVKNNNADSPLAQFSGSFSDYEVSGDWILNKKSLEFTNMYTGEMKSGKKATFSTLSGFIANESGDKFLLFCHAANQSVIMYDMASGDAKIVSDSNIYNSGIGNFCFIDNETFIMSSYDENKAAVNKICKF